MHIRPCALLFHRCNALLPRRRCAGAAPHRRRRPAILPVQGRGIAGGNITLHHAVSAAHELLRCLFAAITLPSIVSLSALARRGLVLVPVRSPLLPSLPSLPSLPTAPHLTSTSPLIQSLRTRAARIQPPLRRFIISPVHATLPRTLHAVVCRRRTRRSALGATPQHSLHRRRLSLLPPPAPA
jgi:hypothetical protein